VVVGELYSFSICIQASLDVTDSRASRFGKSTGSFDLGSPRSSSIDGTSSPARAFERNGTNHSQDFDSFGAFGSLATSKDSNKTSLFGGTFSPKAASTPSLFADSPRASNNSFLRFDSFGPGSPVAPRRPSG
jgi:epidermal growth factor receptor substrate 15